MGLGVYSRLIVETVVPGYIGSETDGEICKWWEGGTLSEKQPKTEWKYI